MVVALAGGPGSHPGFFEKVPIDVGSDNSPWCVEEDADELSLFDQSERGSAVVFSVGAATIKEYARNETSCHCA